MRKRTLSSYLLKKYIFSSVFLILALSLFYNLAGEFLLGNLSPEEILLAENLIQRDYENTDISYLEDVDGWIEILDEDNRVIYTKGNVLEPKEQYTQQELLEQSSFGNLVQGQQYKVAGIISVTKKEEKPKERYAATYSVFERDGRKLTGVVKIPASKLGATFMFLNPAGRTGRRLVQTMSVIAAGVILILLFFLLRYARSVKIHLAAPNQELVSGLKKMTSGDYAARIRLNAEYEYGEIEDSFNLMAEELERATDDRERLTRERRQMLSSLAHDLRTPMTTIQGYAKALSEHVVKEPGQQEEYLDAIYRKSIHLNEMITKLLEYSRLENDSYTLDMQKTDFAELVRNAAAEQYGEFEAHELLLEIEIPEHEIQVLADRTELMRVITNLFRNCIVHNPPGISAKIEVEETKEKCSLTVWDNGTQIDPQMREKIFEPFISCDSARGTKNGSGLGLAICRKIMEKHGGTIRVVDDKTETYDRTETYGRTGWKGFRLELRKIRR